MRGKLVLCGTLLPLFLLLVFSGHASAQAIQCNIKLACGGGETELLRMSDLFNAHAEIPGYSGPSSFPSPYRICCSGSVAVGTSCVAPVHEAFLWLRQDTNSHVAEDPLLPAYVGQYTKEVCISGINVKCNYGPNCNAFGPSPGDAECLASISGSGNAHISNCTGAGAYSEKICCWADVGEPYKSVRIIDRYGRSNPEWINRSGYFIGVTHVINFSVRIEASDPSGIASMDLEYAIMEQDGTPIIPWQLWKSTPNNSTFTYGVLIPGPVFDPLNPNNYDGKRIAFRMNATDNGGIVNRGSTTAPWLNTTLDLTLPTCAMNQPGNWDSGRYWSQIFFNISWQGQDLTATGGPGSGIDRYIVEYSSGGLWYNVFDKVFGINRTAVYYCNGSQCTLPVTGAEGNTYRFRVSAVDRAGNKGLISTVVNTTIDGTSPISILTVPTKLWVNSTSPFGPPLLWLRWQSSETASGFNCTYLKYRLCNYLASAGTGVTCNNWGNWYYVKDNITAGSMKCVSPTSCVGNTCYWEAFFSGQGYDQSGSLVQGQLQTGQIYNFSVWATDIAGNIESHLASDPVVDLLYPYFIFDIINDTGGSIKDTGLISSATSYINITATATDDHSGVAVHRLDYCVIKGMETCLFDIAGPGAPWGGSTSIVRKIDVDASTVVKFMISVQDDAGNWNISSWRYVSSHKLANFLLHSLYLSLGQQYDLRVHVRNMNNRFDNVTLNLTGYGMAYFMPETGSEVSTDGRGIKVRLQPQEGKEILVRVLTSTVRQDAFVLNLTATSEVDPTLIDEDMVFITVGYPASFPDLSDYSVVMIAIISVIIAYGALGNGELIKKRRI